MFKRADQQARAIVAKLIPYFSPPSHPKPAKLRVMRYLVTAAVALALLFGSCANSECDTLRGKARERCYFVESAPPGPVSSSNYPN